MTSAIFVPFRARSRELSVHGRARFSLNYADAPLGAEISTDRGRMCLKILYPAATEEPTDKRELGTYINVRVGRFSGRLFGVDFAISPIDLGAGTRPRSGQRTSKAELADAVLSTLGKIAALLQEMGEKSSPGQKLNYRAAAEGLQLTGRKPNPGWLRQALDGQSSLQP